MFGCDGQAKRATMIQKGEREADFWDNPVVEKDEMEEHELQAYIEAGGTVPQLNTTSSLLHAWALTALWPSFVASRSSVLSVLLTPSLTAGGVCSGEHVTAKAKEGVGVQLDLGSKTKIAAAREVEYF